VRVANNLLIGLPATNWVPFGLEDDFDALAVFQNNKVIAGGQLTFMETSGSVETRYDTSGAAETYLCGASIIANGNELLAVDPEDVFTDYGGDDDDPATLADNDWSLKADADVAIRTGGLTLGAGNNCGGADCTTGPFSTSCGEVTDDLRGPTSPRTEPYSVGAYEVD
jgi:hypothetical protein